MSEPTTQVQPVDLQQYTEQELQKFRPYDAQIAELTKRGRELTIAGPEDKAGYDAVFTFRQRVKGLRVEVEKMRKAITEDAHRFKKAVDDEGRRIRQALESIETPLEEQEARYNEARLKIQEERIREEREQQQRRVATLVKLGMELEGDTYKLDEFTIDNAQIALMKQPDFDSFVEQVQLVADEKRAIRERYQAREKQLFALGMTWDGSAFQLGNRRLASEDVARMLDSDFEQEVILVKDEVDRIEMEKVKAEEAKQAERKRSTRAMRLAGITAVETPGGSGYTLADRPFDDIEVPTMTMEVFNGDDEAFEQGFTALMTAREQIRRRIEKQAADNRAKEQELADREAKLKAENEAAEKKRKRELIQARIDELTVHGAVPDQGTNRVTLGNLKTDFARLGELSEDEFTAVMVTYRDERLRMTQAEQEAKAKAEEERLAKLADRDHIAEVVGEIDGILTRFKGIEPRLKSAIAKQGLKAAVEKVTYARNYVNGILNDL